MNKPMWVMAVPVISTQHMPHTDALEDLVHYGNLCAIYGEGGFVHLPEDPIDVAMWTGPVLTWLRENFGYDANWVRFDCDAEVIEDLPTYEWSK